MVPFSRESPGRTFTLGRPNTASGEALTLGRQTRLAQIAGLSRAEVQAACPSPDLGLLQVPTEDRRRQRIDPPHLSLKQLHCTFGQEKREVLDPGWNEAVTGTLRVRLSSVHQPEEQILEEDTCHPPLVTVSQAMNTGGGDPVR